MKRIIGLLLAVTLFLGMAACKDTGSVQGKDPAYEVWGTDNLVSVVRETSYNEKYFRTSACLEYAMARNESEYDQIIVTAGSALSYVELIKTDLTNGKDKIPAENIEVYYQRYVYCTDTTQWPGVMGVKDNINPYNVYYPDMLMDMDVAVSYHENKVAKDQNQGFTVRVTTGNDIPSGTYTGTFTLLIDGTETDIPVTVTVWDITLGAATGKTLFYPQAASFINGEFDNSPEMYRTYYERALEFNINLEYLPGHISFKYAADPDSYVEEINRYWDHPNFTCYAIPGYETGGWGVIDETGKNLIKEYMLAVAHASTAERNLFDKLVVNHDSLDEPQYSDSYGRVGTYYETFYSIEEDVIRTLEEEGFFKGFTAEQAEKFKEKIRNIPQIMTSGYTEDLPYNGGNYPADRVNAWCPTIDLYSTQLQRDQYEEAVRSSGGEQWFYTCNQPQFPYPSHFTEASPVGNRVLRWIQYKLGITGYLYWGAVYFGSELRDPYEQTQVWANNPNGDGYFFYPGRAYGSEPFPTAKLLSFSDGQEDMDMLYLFEEKYLAVAAAYGMTETEARNSFDGMLGAMFDRIIDGVTYNFDYTALLRLREEIAQLLMMLEQGDLVTYALEGITAEYRIYSQEAGICVNEQEITGVQTQGGYIYAGECLLEKAQELHVVTGHGSVSLFLSEPREELSWKAENISVNGGEFALQENELQFQLPTRSDDITFFPMLSVEIAQFENISTFEELDNFVFYFRNGSDFGFVLSVGVAKGANTIELERFFIEPNGVSKISLPLIYNNQNGIDYTRVIGKADSFYFEIYDQSGKTINGSIYGAVYTIKER